jgi:glycosyltransferase involved in cell wall biosynthesis
VNAPSRATILFAPFDGWDMQPYQPIDGRGWIHGGVRALIELAAGLAAIGLDVELRGAFVESEVVTIEQAVGVQLRRPSARRRPESDELVIVPEAHDDPLVFARIALSGARAVLLLLAPIGLFGWPFDPTPIPHEDEILGFDLELVGRPESHLAARSLGLELWTNAFPIAERAAADGIDIKYVGSGRPTPYPEPGEKSVDVLALAENRWAPLAIEALGEIPARFSTRIQPRGTHDELLAALSTTRVFLHPARIEGRSRLCEEARAMRAVPVLLASNVFGEGYGPEYGSVVVESLQEMPAAAVALLEDPERLAALAERGYRTARRGGDWSAYEQRLREVIAVPDHELLLGAYVRSRVGERAAEEHARALTDRAEILRHRDQLAGERETLARELEALADERDALARERDRLGSEAASLREQSEALVAQLDTASDEARRLGEAIRGMESSTSWRITRPLRFLRSQR